MIRRFRPGDESAVATLFRTVDPGFVLTDRGLLHWVATERKAGRLASWVAKEGPDVIGWGEARDRWEFGPGAASIFVGVHPDARGRGLGGRLYELAGAHVSDAARVYSFVPGDEAGRRFLLGRGFREDRADRTSVLDPAAVDLSELPPLEAAKAVEGFRLVKLGELGDRGPELHQLFEAVDRDVPSPEPLVPIRFEEFRERVLDFPDLDHDASVVVLGPDGRAVALSWLHVDREGGRAHFELTGTLREFRRRGLARLAKLATIRWAVEQGLTAMYTGNDTENRAMLALNDELGFRPRLVYQEFVKELR